MADIIKATRGLKIDFEEVPLLLGEPGLATDEERLYIGGNNGNIPLPNAADLSEKANNTDNARTTTAKDVTGAVNELNANKPTVETGTWTPTIKGSTTVGVNTYGGSNAGRYIKEGKKITCFFRLIMSAKDVSMAGNISIGGLPYVALSNNANRASLSISTINYVTFPIGVSQLSGMINVGDSSISLVGMGSGIVVQSIIASNLASSIEIDGSITYETSV